MKKILLLLIVGLFAFILSSCDPALSFSDGYIDVSISNLDLLTGYTQGQSNLLCYAYDFDGSTYTSVSSSLFSDFGSNSVSFGIGAPDFLFTGGTTYYIDIFVDIDGNDVYDDAGVDYWLRLFEEVTVDGDENVSITNTDFVLRQ